MIFTQTVNLNSRQNIQNENKTIPPERHKTGLSRRQKNVDLLRGGSSWPNSEQNCGLFRQPEGGLNPCPAESFIYYFSFIQNYSKWRKIYLCQIYEKSAIKLLDYFSIYHGLVYPFHQHYSTVGLRLAWKRTVYVIFKLRLHIRVMREAWCVLHNSTCTSRCDASKLFLLSEGATQCGSPVFFTHREIAPYLSKYKRSHFHSFYPRESIKWLHDRLTWCVLSGEYARPKRIRSTQHAWRACGVALPIFDDFGEHASRFTRHAYVES